MTRRVLGLLEGYGVETELMIVDAESLEVRPLADEALRTMAGSEGWVADADDGPVGLSNELVAHVIELKTAEPRPSFDGLAAGFQDSVRRIGAALGSRGAKLMPTGMHPFMDPARDTELWPHENAEVYGAFDRLFDCRRHGWANLQSVHLNLSFGDDREFGRLMAAVRLVLPLVPALAASSPVVEGAATGQLDSRLTFYWRNSSRAPSMTGEVVPEPIFDVGEYREKVFGPIDRDLERLAAPAFMFGREWTNARGAITRFDRMAIEIRLIDAQECPRADLAVAAAVAGLVRGLVEERWSSQTAQREHPSSSLVAQLEKTIERGPDARLADPRYAELFGLRVSADATAGELWRALVESTFPGPAELEEPVHVILREGVLAQRILIALGSGFDRARLRGVYERLCGCLAGGCSFLP